MSAIFVASPTEIYYGQDAENRLHGTNDAQYATEEGVLAVTRERWLQAQQYERDTWMRYELKRGDDRNIDHMIGFGEYRALPKRLGNYLELGCGPFTNARLILRDRQAKNVTLVDPLIKEYHAHPFCWYNQTDQWTGKRDLIASTAEEYEPDRLFDTVVLINVLPHCFDANRVLETIRKALRPGGILVFHEPPRDLDPRQHYNVGHPIAVKEAWLEAWLAEFEQVYRKDWYFIGKRK